MIRASSLLQVRRRIQNVGIKLPRRVHHDPGDRHATDLIVACQQLGEAHKASGDLSKAKRCTKPVPMPRVRPIFSSPFPQRASVSLAQQVLDRYSEAARWPSCPWLARLPVPVPAPP